MISIPQSIEEITNIKFELKSGEDQNISIKEEGIVAIN